MKIIENGLTFDDVLLQPKYSNVQSRSNISLDVRLPKIATTLKHPIVPANMKTIIEYEMAKEIYLSGGMGILHRFMPLTKQIGILNDLSEIGTNVYSHIGFSVGVQKADYDNMQTLVDCGAKIICIDVAHGDSELCINMCNYISTNYPDILLVAGNIATETGAIKLWQAGADIVKVGVGPGSLCTTRIETGNGVPQLTALIEANEARNQMYRLYDAFSQPRRELFIMADGGIKSAGDIVKALCLADLVMVGNIFAGCEETPGNTISIDGKSYKEYVGSSTHKANHIEGVAALVQYKGKFNDVLIKLLEGVKSGCSYQGVNNLTDLKTDPIFIKMTGAGLRESHPHDVIVR